MACSKYASTRQTTHAARMSRLLFGPCTDLLRGVLRQHIPESSFPATLQRRKEKLLKKLHYSQRELLFPPAGTFSGSYEDFDISLLYLLLRNITNITPHRKGWGYPPNDTDRSVSANIDRIRMIRNKIGAHCHRPDLSDAEFSTSWAKLKRSVVEIVRRTGISTNYDQCIDSLVKEPMDPDREDYWLHRLQKQKIDDADRYEEVVKKVDRNEKRFECIERKIEEILKEVKDTGARNILENTKVDLKYHKSSKTYVRTGQVDAVIEKLREKHIGILTGRSGDGKSTIAKQVLCELSEDDQFIPVIITEPSEWNKVINSNQKMVVHVDDMFGSTNFDTSAIDKWKKIFDLIISSTNEGKLFILITSRKSILAEVRKACHQRFIFDHEYEIDLTTNILTVEEKGEMLLEYEKVHTYTASELKGNRFRDYEKDYGKDAVYELTILEEKSILVSKPYYGFPQTCFLFFARKEFFQLGSKFFWRADITLFESIDFMRKSADVKNKIRHCILVYVFVVGSIHIRDVKEDVFQEICELSNITKPIDADIGDAIQDLEGIYLSPSIQKNTYTFSHVTIRDVVVASFGKLAPDIIIQISSNEILQELIRTEGYEVREGEVILTIQKKYYSLLADRLLTEGIEYSVDHPATGDPEFTPEFFDAIKKTPSNKHAVTKKLWDI